MTRQTREALLLRTFATLADTLVADYDVVDLLQTLVDSCRDLLDTTAAGILLADPAGELELVASTSESSRLVEMMQLGAEAGPCIESFRTGRVVSLASLAEAPAEWSAFRDAAEQQGFASVHAVPLRLRETTIGTLNLLRNATGMLGEDDVVAAKALADVATIGILHERAIRESSIITEQLRGALSSRIVIEQAKGVVSHTRQVPVDEAFTLIRQYARSNSRRLSAVAADLVERRLTLPE